MQTSLYHIFTNCPKDSKLVPSCLSFDLKLPVILNQSKIYCYWIKSKQSYLQECFAMSPWPKETRECLQIV